MKRLSLLFLTMLWFTFPGGANNVRIEGDVKVTDTDVDINTKIATVKFTVKWDNSWRDAFNYDGVYLFMKFKVDGEKEVWHHAYLMNEGHELKTPGYEVQMSNSSGTANRCEGLFLYRSEKSYGPAEVNLELKWLITSNPDRALTREEFAAGKVFVSAMGMEMVYIPRGAYRLGDSESANTFKYKDVALPERLDILSDRKYIYTSSEQPEGTRTANPPEFAVNHMNDPGNGNANAWVGAAKNAGDEYWMVSFDKGKNIKTLAIESVAGGVPSAWKFQGRNPSGDWVDLSINGSAEGTAGDWAVGSTRTYPCSRSLRIDTKMMAYTDYRIQILENMVPVIKNVAMSTEDWLGQVDNSVLVYEPTILMSNRRNLYAEDADTWSGTLPATYPNGYPAYWVMKYEISQEQYVAFLNKLTAMQQRVRAGSDLIKLTEGDYIFGANKKRPSARNGIKLASIGVNDAPYVFANDLNPEDNEYAQDGDGQTLACNFLNAGDMLAYADWCGLRPLTEMEFEKMARRPYPEPALRREYAWNAVDGFEPTTAVDALTKGKKTEKPSNGNINANKQLNDLGPIRCGAYAKTGSSGQKAAGASFWGVMELSGNLAEIYYNTNTEGRKFHGDANNYHGNGKISTNGATDITESYWPVNEQAFALRGGSFLSPKEEVTISDRTSHWGIFGSVSEVNGKRDSTMTFRLGRTAPIQSIKAEVSLQNGMTSADAAPVDTICNGEDYEIRGSVPAEIQGAYRIAWFVSGDLGTSWDIIEGEEEPYLKLTNLRNINNATNYFREYQYQRRIFSNGTDVLQTRPVSVRVIDSKVTISRYNDTVDIYDHSAGIQITSKQTAKFTWYWLRKNSESIELKPEYILTPNISELNYLKYKDFNDGAQRSDEDVKVMIETKVMGHCLRRDTINVYVKKAPDAVVNLIGSDNAIVNPDFKCGDILIDNSDADALRYKTVKIGNRCWFAENMRKRTGSYVCYGNSEQNCVKYGRLYSWRASINAWGEEAQGICPKGWHIPDNAEWNQLVTDAGGAVNLKSQLNNWTYAAATLGTNKSGFSALASGVQGNGAGCFPGPVGQQGINTYTIWWSSSYGASVGWGRNSSNNGWLYAHLPYYVTLNNTNAWTVNYSFFYCGNSYSAGTYSNSPNAFYDNFYFPIRCIKNGIVE